MSKYMYDELKIDDNDPYKDNVVKENFCGACLALPLAFAGAGTATATSGDGGKNGGKSNLFFWSVIITIIGLIVTFWYLSGDC
jgi:hypothetical protein